MKKITLIVLALIVPFFAFAEVDTTAATDGIASGTEAVVSIILALIVGYGAIKGLRMLRLELRNLR